MIKLSFKSMNKMLNYVSFYNISLIHISYVICIIYVDIIMCFILEPNILSMGDVVRGALVDQTITLTNGHSQYVMITLKVLCLINRIMYHYYFRLYVIH